MRRRKSNSAEHELPSNSASDCIKAGSRKAGSLLDLEIPEMNAQFERTNRELGRLEGHPVTLTSAVRQTGPLEKEQ